MFYLAQAGSSLQRVDTNGQVTTLTLPAGVTIDATVRGIFAVLGGVVVFARASSVNLIIDPSTFGVSGLGLTQPLTAPVLSAGSSTGLSGVYSAKVGFARKNANGVITNESPLSQASAPLTITGKNIVYSNIPVSPDTTVNCRVIYRTTAGGAVYFKLLEIDDNTSTSIIDATPDAALSLLPADPDLGNAPGTSPGTRMKLLIEWKGRLWGVSNTLGERDAARYTEIGTFYKWPSDNFINAQGKGEDSFGIVAFVRRRDDLGLLKRTRINKIIGDSPSNFECLNLSEQVGCIAPDSVVVIHNKAYWLNDDGVYRWDDSGVECISRDDVDDWFTKDTTFNRARFQYAFASWNPLVNSYELNLAAAGSEEEDRWISFHIDGDGGRGAWLGPHLTAAFTPTSRAKLNTDEGVPTPVIGADDGYLYLQNQTTPSDIEGDTTVHAISANCRDRFMHNGNPAMTHSWGRIAIASRIESAGTTMTVTPYVGGVNAAAQAAVSIDLTRGFQIVRRAGVGRLCSLEFAQATAGRRFLLYGYDVLNTFDVGLRG